MDENNGALVPSVVNTQFVPDNIDNGEIVSESGEAVMRIDDVEYPLLDEGFSMRLIQNSETARADGSGLSNDQLRANRGKIYVSGLEEFFDQRVLLPICVATTTQALFESAYSNNGNNSAVCRSSNGYTPVNNGLPTMNDACAEVAKGYNGYYRKVVCPYAMWSDGKKPACQMSLLVAFLDITDPETPFPVSMWFKRTAMAAYNAMFKEYRSIRNVAKLRKRSVYDYVINFTVEDKGNYYVPKLSLVYSEDKPSRYLPLTSWYARNLYLKEKETQETSNTVSDMLDDAITDDPNIDFN